MNTTIIVTGTDTGIGKTVFSAGLTRALGATYWKPVQSGLDEETDSQAVARLSGQPILPEAYRLRLPASPHLSAAAQDVEIGPIALPVLDSPLVVEGAGGALVPLNGSTLYADLMAIWQKPVIMVARTSLGTINHSLLTIEALRSRRVPLLGVAFVGDEMEDSRNTICHFANLPDLGRLPLLPTVTRTSLIQAFSAIDITTIKKALA